MPGEPLDTIIRAEIPEIDDCPVLTRIKAFMVDAGTLATLEHTFRNRKGNPVDLSSYIHGVTSNSSASESDALNAKIILKIKEIMAHGPDNTRNPYWTIEGAATKPEDGILQANLPIDFVQQAGVYMGCWGVLDANNNVLATNNTLISVERSLFLSDPDQLYKDLGPPTIGEIRMAYMDSSPAENLLIDRIEFTDEQVVEAIRKPVEYWNEIPPPIETFTTRNFPFRYNWLRGIHGHLLEFAAHNFRRNHMKYEAGGNTVDDLNKEAEYLRAAKMYLDEYRQWCLNAKVAINLRKFHGNFGSAYARGWW